MRRQPSAIVYAVLGLALWPQQTLVNQHHGVLGTIVAGQWACCLAVVTLIALVQIAAPWREARIDA